MSDQESSVRVRTRLEGDRGANLVEYALLVSLIFLVALSAVQLFGRRATNKMSCASSAIGTTTGGVVC